MHEEESDNINFYVKIKIRILDMCSKNMNIEGRTISMN